MNRERAEILALQVLEWILQNDDIAPVFLHSTGVSTADLCARAQDPDLLAAILEFTLMDDAWVLSAACHADVRPEDLLLARAVLPGGDAPHWS